MRTPKLAALQDKMGSIFDRVETAADALHKRMDLVGNYVEQGVDKLGLVIDGVEAQGRQLHDAVNQISNGGPPLDDTPAS